MAVFLQEAINKLGLQMSQTQMVLLMSSVLEAIIEHGIKSKMRPLTKSQRERLFEGYGPIASFSAKIDIGYSLRVFDEKVLADLRVIKEIRNEFAHPEHLIHFGDDALAAMVAKFTDRPKDMDAQRLFFTRVTYCLEHIEHGRADVDLKWYTSLLHQYAAALRGPDKTR
jgi:DNA-binding MltR family transcriptional regulator